MLSLYPNLIRDTGVNSEVVAVSLGPVRVESGAAFDGPRIYAS